jgi:GNAT superfamily N-acetyltransferase
MSRGIRQASTDDEILRCYPVMRELRPQVAASEFLERIRRQMSQGYRLVYLARGGETRAVAGYRLLENLAWGRFLYVDDLVTRECDRSRGFGQILMKWLAGEAVERGCTELHLDSGVQRFGAHRFYLVQGMDITCHHFAKKLGGSEKE